MSGSVPVPFDTGLCAASQRARQTAAVTTSGSLAAAASFNSDSVDDSLTGDEYLDKLEEKVNKSIDDDLASLVDGFQQLVMLASIKDKDKVLIAQDSFQSDIKADTMVRSAQSLSLLSSSVSLSLLLSKSPDPSLDQEARKLIEETEEEKRKCRELFNLLGGRGGKGNDEIFFNVETSRKGNNQIESQKNVGITQEKGNSISSQEQEETNVIEKKKSDQEDSTKNRIEIDSNNLEKKDQGDEDEDEDEEMEDVEM